jgi:protein gp37
MAKRLEAMGQDKYAGTTRISGGRPKWTGKLKFDHSSLKLPTRWKRGRLVFVNSMSDLFHDDVPLEFIQQVFHVMAQTPQHTYQVLTKRAERLSELGSKLDWGPNIWMGVSVESEAYWWRVDHLRSVGARVRFVSLEPLLGPLSTLDFTGIHWAIAGGESGPHARPVDGGWRGAFRDRHKRGTGCDGRRKRC